MNRSCGAIRRQIRGCRRGRRKSIRLARGGAPERGLTLIESLVATAVMTVIGIAMYTVIESSNRLTKQETHVATAQQSARAGMLEVARIVRQGRAGQLFYGNSILPLANNSPGGTFFTDLSGGKHYVRKGTDVLGVRGVLMGDRYSFTNGDVTCGSLLCTSNTPMTVTIRSTAKNGIANFPSGGMPAIAAKSRPFYFGVVYGTLQTITISNTAFLIPLYYVGLVDTTGAWYTATANTFTFTMDPRDEGARLLNAVSGVVRELVQSPYSGGAVDEVLFFVDEGPTDATTEARDTHPILTEAIFDPSTGRYDVQALVEEVEDFQVAFGVDGIDGSTRDRGISPARLDTTGTNKDEWVGNVASEIETSLPFSTSEPHFIDAFIDRAVNPAVPDLFSRAVPALRSVWLSMVVKAGDPDLRFDGPGANGFEMLDSTAIPFSSPTLVGRPYRRRLITLPVSLRNFQ